jgi:aerotaxis receptor
VSGFTREELIGQPHNIVRHPDMPEEAFADMWRTIQSGKAWNALVKNRRKDGDHYWVRANVAPITRHGQIVGYLSVRTAPTRAEIDAAEQLYAAMREGRLHGHALERGVLVPTSWRRWVGLGRRASTGARLASALALAALPPALVGAALAYLGGQWGVALAALGAGALGAALGGVLVARQILRPLRAIAQHASDVAAGHLYAQPPLERLDDLGVLARAVNQAGLNLRALVDDVATQVQALSAASEQIAQGNADLSQRTERAAANLEETAASTEQITATVRQNADSARTASALAQQTMAAAEEGGRVVHQVVQTMNGIAEGSQRIAEITSVIDAIAFQTNILALNAAVEAARAGEAGRGFAVVAGEVRSLAQRSAEAARQIKALIDHSVAQVQAGAAQTAEAGARIAAIVKEIKQVADLIGEISAASAEQTTGVAQISESVALLDQGTQQNAALVEELSAAATSLHAQAEHLAEALAVWRSADGGLAEVARVPVCPRAAPQRAASPVAAARREELARVA